MFCHWQWTNTPFSVRMVFMLLAIFIAIQVLKMWTKNCVKINTNDIIWYTSIDIYLIYFKCFHFIFLLWHGMDGLEFHHKWVNGWFRRNFIPILILICYRNIILRKNNEMKIKCVRLLLFYHTVFASFNRKLILFITFTKMWSKLNYIRQNEFS